MHSWIWEHRDAITLAGRLFFAGAGLFAIWSIQRDVRAAWPRIVELWRNRHDDA